MLSLIFLIFLLAIWGLVLVFISFADDYVSFFIIATPFIISLFFLKSLFIWFPDLSEIISFLGIVIGIVIIYQFINLFLR